jgi:hypothetical protein
MSQYSSILTNVFGNDAGAIGHFTKTRNSFDDIIRQIQNYSRNDEFHKYRNVGADFNTDCTALAIINVIPDSETAIFGAYHTFKPGLTRKQITMALGKNYFYPPYDINMPIFSEHFDELSQEQYSQESQGSQGSIASGVFDQNSQELYGGSSIDPNIEGVTINGIIKSF